MIFLTSARRLLLFIWTFTVTSLWTADELSPFGLELTVPEWVGIPGIWDRAGNSALSASLVGGGGAAAAAGTKRGGTEKQSQRLTPILPLHSEITQTLLSTKGDNNINWVWFHILIYVLFVDLSIQNTQGIAGGYPLTRLNLVSLLSLSVNVFPLRVSEEYAFMLSW